MMETKVKTLAYWVTTALIAAELLAGGTADLARGREVLVAGQPVADVLHQLGYPTYLLTILGAWKLLAAVAILAPGLPRLKEWAYAGTFFELTGAAFSLVAVGDGAASVVAPLLLAACVVASWAMRPPSRTLGVISWPRIDLRRSSTVPKEERRRAR